MAKNSEPPEQLAEKGQWGEFHGPVAPPRDRAGVYATFGNPGTVAAPDKAWQKANIITVRDLPGIPTKWHFQCHRLVEPALREGLRRAKEVSPYKIETAASFVLRHVRHDSSKPLSLHSWGIAIDIDPKRNSAKTVKRGTLPVPWSKKWFEMWPGGLDKAFVEAMESVGFTWGGVWGSHEQSWAERARGCSFADPQHYEFVVR